LSSGHIADAEKSYDLAVSQRDSFVGSSTAQDSDSDKARQEENRKIAAGLPEGEGKAVPVKRCGPSHSVAQVSGQATSKVLEKYDQCHDGCERHRWIKKKSIVWHNTCKRFRDARGREYRTGAAEIAAVPGLDSNLAASHRELPRKGPQLRVNERSPSCRGRKRGFAGEGGQPAHGHFSQRCPAVKSEGRC